METIYTLTDSETGDRLGAVFFDDGWDAYGWKTNGFTNGPYDTKHAALADLKAEFSGVSFRVTP